MSSGNGGVSVTSGGLAWPEEPGDARKASETKPRQTFVAVLLMWVGAAAAVLAAVQTAYFRFWVPDSEIRRQIVAALEQTEQKVNAETIGAMESALTSMLMVNIVVVGGWVLMALMNDRGFGWARVTATMLAILNVPWTLFMAPDLPHLVGVVVGLSAVLFLWLPASREWFAGRSGRVLR